MRFTIIIAQPLDHFKEIGEMAAQAHFFFIYANRIWCLYKHHENLSVQRRIIENERVCASARALKRKREQETVKEKHKKINV